MIDPGLSEWMYARYVRCYINGPEKIGVYRRFASDGEAAMTFGAVLPSRAVQKLSRQPEVSYGSL